MWSMWIFTLLQERQQKHGISNHKCNDRSQMVSDNVCSDTKEGTDCSYICWRNNVCSELISNESQTLPCICAVRYIPFMYIGKYMLGKDRRGEIPPTAKNITCNSVNMLTNKCSKEMKISMYIQHGLLWMKRRKILLSYLKYFQVFLSKTLLCPSAFLRWTASCLVQPRQLLDKQ